MSNTEERADESVEFLLWYLEAGVLSAVCRLALKRKFPSIKRILEMERGRLISGTCNHNDSINSNCEMIEEILEIYEQHG